MSGFQREKEFTREEKKEILKALRALQKISKTLEDILEAIRYIGLKLKDISESDKKGG